MSNTAKINFDGDASDAIKENERLRRSLQKTISQNKDLADSSKKRAKGATSALAKTAGQVLTLTAGYNALKSSITAVISEQSRMKQGELDANLSTSDSFLSFFNQSGIKAGSQEAIKAKIQSVASAQRTGLTINQVNQAKKGVVSGGGNVENIAPILDAIAGGQVQDPQQFAKNLSLTRQDLGLKDSKQSMRDIARVFFNLNKQQSVELSDLSTFGRTAGKPAVFGIGLEENAQFFTDILDVAKTPERAGTAVKTFFSRLRTASGDKGVSKALGQLGISASDVDFAKNKDGTKENVADVVELFVRNLKSTDAVKGDIALEKIFGKEAGPSIADFLRKKKTGTFRQRSKSLSDESFFDLNVANATGQFNFTAAQNRIDTKKFDVFKMQSSNLRLNKEALQDLDIDRDLRTGKITESEALLLRGENTLRREIIPATEAIGNTLQTGIKHSFDNSPIGLIYNYFTNSDEREKNNQSNKKTGDKRSDLK